MYELPSPPVPQQPLYDKLRKGECQTLRQPRKHVSDWQISHGQKPVGKPGGVRPLIDGEESRINLPCQVAMLLDSAKVTHVPLMLERYRRHKAGLV